MIKLSRILLEVVDTDIDLSDLRYLDDEIKKDLEEVPQNEIITLGTAALALAVPGMLNSIAKVVKAIAKKNKIDLTKGKQPAWYEVLEKVTEQIDNYLDTPLKLILKPFIKDNTKREKAAKILKAALLTVMALLGSLDISQIKNTTTAIKQLAPEIAQNLIEAITERNKDKIVSVLKNVFS